MEFKAPALRSRFFACVFLYVAFSSHSALGQAISGNLVGTVVDPSGAAVNNAEVQALKIDNGIATTTKTKNTGEYRFENLPLGKTVLGPLLRRSK